MTCPRCNHKVVVADSVHNPATNETYRKRKCTTCGHVFYTIEFEVDCDDTFKDIWKRNYRISERRKKK